MLPRVITPMINRAPISLALVLRSAAKLLTRDEAATHRGECGEAAGANGSKVTWASSYGCFRG